MITTIDKAGRLVIPKPLRDAMGLRPGVPLDLSYSDGQILIEYAPVEARVRIAEDGLPIIETDWDDELRGELADFDLRRALEEVRDENPHGLL